MQIPQFQVFHADNPLILLHPQLENRIQHHIVRILQFQKFPAFAAQIQLPVPLAVSNRLRHFRHFPQRTDDFPLYKTAEIQRENSGCQQNAQHCQKQRKQEIGLVSQQTDVRVASLQFETSIINRDPQPDPEYLSRYVRAGRIFRFLRHGIDQFSFPVIQGEAQNPILSSADDLLQRPEGHYSAYQGSTPPHN